MNTFNSKKIILKELLSDNLALRQNANDLFDYVESLSEGDILFDFTGVTSMSRSFAHQYLLRKKTCKKEITELGKAFDVKKMFDIAEKNRRTEPLIDIKNIKVLTIRRCHTTPHVGINC
jgi:hypothetical protein